MSRAIASDPRENGRASEGEAERAGPRVDADGVCTKVHHRFLLPQYV